MIDRSENRGAEPKPSLGLRILSLGYTRSLWDEREGNDNRRMRHYAEGVARYTVLVNSRQAHGLFPLRVADNFEALPTGGRTAPGSWWRMYRLGLRELRTRSYDVIQAQDPNWLGACALLLGWRAKVPVVVCVYGPNPHDRNWVRTSALNRALAIVGRRVLRACAGVQVDGAATERSLIAHGIPKAKVFRKPMIPVDLARFLAINRHYRRAFPVTLFFAGRLAPQKELSGLLRACARIEASRPGRFRLRLAGDGPLRKRLAGEALRLGLEQVVEFMGQLDREDLQRAFEQADVFALSSSYEGFPRVLVEAAASGLPIVTTCVSGAEEMVVAGETGFITPIGDEEAFASGLERLIADAGLRERMGRSGRRLAESRMAEGDGAERQWSIWSQVAATRVCTNFRNP